MWYYIIIYLIVTWLSIDLSYQVYELGFMHWKKKRKSLSLPLAKSIYRKEMLSFTGNLSHFIPILNLIKYLYNFIFCATNEFEYSSKNVLYDIRVRNIGINAKILQRVWKPKKKSKVLKQEKSTP
jgi:hypothetical protein